MGEWVDGLLMLFIDGLVREWTAGWMDGWTHDQ